MKMPNLTSWIIYLLIAASLVKASIFEMNQADSLSSASLGPYLVEWDVDSPFLQVKSADSPWRPPIFRTIPNWPFLTVGFATDSTPPIVDGNYKVNEWTLFETPYQNIKKVDVSDRDIVVSGEVWGLVTKASYEMTFTLSETSQLKFNVTTSSLQGTYNRLFLNYWCNANESLHGFGVQYTHWNMKGRRIPILVAEQGIGRGAQPLTAFLNVVGDGAGGDPLTTYAPKAVYVTNYNRSMIFENSEMMFLDTRDDDAIVVEVWGTSLAGRILSGNSMLELVTKITEVTGRMKPLPQWTQRGAIVGLEGGTAAVDEIVDRLITNNVSISALWLQDWVGLRHAFDGDRLKWNWQLDDKHYPAWDKAVQRWAQKDIRVMTYINPFFSKTDGESFGSLDAQRPLRRDLYKEGVSKKYFVQSPHGGPYLMHSGSIEFCMIDTSNPDARRWMKEVIKRDMIHNSSSSGWMADFGEYLPFDAVLYSGESGATYHNQYPLEWAKINEEAVAEARAEGLVGRHRKLATNARAPEDDGEDDVVFFMRSASLQSPQHTALFWLGDQLVSWDNYDGIKTVVLGALSGGLSGHSLTHSDIGGYTMQEMGPLPILRSRELLFRWAEMSAFGEAVFRTHIGSLTSPSNSQIFDDDETMRHFAKFTNVFTELAEYRMKLMREAQQHGWPLIRPMAAHYARDAECWQLTAQYMFGSEFLVAPVLDPASNSRQSTKFAKNSNDLGGDKYLKVSSVKVYIPSHSSFVHLWTGQVSEGGTSGRFVSVDAPIGFPPVFYVKGSADGEALRRYAIAQRYDAVYADDMTKAGVAECESTSDKSKSEARIGPIGDYRDADWFEWLGISAYVSSSWDSAAVVSQFIVDDFSTGGSVACSTGAHFLSLAMEPASALAVTGLLDSNIGGIGADYFSSTVEAFAMAVSSSSSVGGFESTFAVLTDTM